MKIKVLIASPSDVAEERLIAETVIKEWNIRNSEERQLTLDAVLWESHTAPDSGDRTQGIINRQIVDNCDFAIGIFWTKIGTPTGVAPGGAVEEVQRMLTMGKKVMLYFSNAPISRKKVDKKQETKLEKFRASIQKHALVVEYDDCHQFRDKLVHHLDMQVRRWFCSGSGGEGVEEVVVPLSAEEALERYQSALEEELGTTSLLGTHALESIPVTLTDTFVSLHLSDTWRGEKRFMPEALHEWQKESQSRSPEEVMSLVFKKNRLLLVVGDPGSGKTTLLKHYALSCLENEGYKKLGFSKPVVVLYLPLRELITTASGDYDSLPKNLSAWSEGRALGVSDSFFSDWLHHRVTLVLLDGLDEISDPAARIKACDWIDRIVTGFTKACVVVTSRSTGYRKGDGIELRSRHVRADIMDFTQEQQAEFLEKWFQAAFLRELPSSKLTHEEWEARQQGKARKKAETIIAFLAKEENKSLQLLAAVPMLLQIMAILWKERQYLPLTRVELYDAALNYILDYRDRQKELFPLLSAKDARRVLTPVSLWMQEELKKDEASRSGMQQQMQQELDTLKEAPTAPEFCQNLVDRAGLLVEYGEREYLFRHKSFREYMAGVQLEKKMNSNPRSLGALVKHFGDDWWEEPLRFFIGQADAGLFDAFMQKLFDSPVSKEFTQKQQDLLVTIINEAPQKKITALQKKLLNTLTTTNRQRYILSCLKTIGKPEALEAVRKFSDAGITEEADMQRLACEITGTTDLPCSAEVLSDTLGDQYILIKGGSFTYSVTKQQETLPDLYVAKYTVTNRLYRQFISYLHTGKTSGDYALPLESYKQRLLAMAESDTGFSGYLKGEKDIANLFTSYYNNDKRFNKDDQPVMGVTWYAAKAYCLWLSLLENNSCDLYRLPSEMEWEYAAAGKENRSYPWGEKEPSKLLANYNEHEGATTPVGRYPEGATPEGLYDMAGNVWEWTETLYDENTSDEFWKPARSVRGGSWLNDSDYLRCSFRNVNHPVNDRLSDVGFRVVRPSLLYLSETLKI